MLKRLVLFLLALIVILQTPCFAISYQYLGITEGIYHADGSYQFNDEEVKALNLWLELEENSDKSMAEMLQEIAPEYELSLSNHKLKELTMINAFSFINGGNTLDLNSNDNGLLWMQKCRTTIERYGQGLLVTGYTEHIDSPWEYAITAAQLWQNDPLEYRVSYSVNAGTNTRIVTATVYGEPPTGTYHGESTHSFPYYCPVTGDESTMTIGTSSRSLSYVFPW